MCESASIHNTSTTMTTREIKICPNTHEVLLEVITLLTTSKYNYQAYNDGNKPRIETRVTDDIVSAIEKMECQIVKSLTKDELKEQAFELLDAYEQDEEENDDVISIDLDYYVYILREGCMEEYYDRIISITYDKDTHDLDCHFAYGIDMCLGELDAHEQEQLLQNIIDQLQ